MREPLDRAKRYLYCLETFRTMLFVAIRFDPQSSKYSTTVISVCSKKKKKGGGSGGKIIKRNTVVSHQSWLAKCRLQEENP